MVSYKQKLALFALTVGMAFSAQAVDTSSAAKNVGGEIPAEILAHYEAAASGNSDATEKAFEGLTKLRERNPDSALVITVLGSTETMMARDSFIPWRQLKYLEKGMAQIDKGISMLQPQDAVNTFQGVPITLWVKNTAGCTYVEVPKMFNRLEAGYKLLTDALQSEEVATLPFEKLASTYMCAGSAAKKLDDMDSARKYLQTIVEKMPGTEEAKQASELLKS